MAAKEARARIKLNKLLEESGWRFFDGAHGKSNVVLEPSRPDFALVDSTFLMSLLNAPEFIQVLLGNSVENAKANVSMGVLGSLTIPIQRAIVAEIEVEQALGNANKELIARFDAKIKATINRVWGDA